MSYIVISEKRRVESRGVGGMSECVRVDQTKSSYLMSCQFQVSAGKFPTQCRKLFLRGGQSGADLAKVGRSGMAEAQ